MRKFLALFILSPSFVVPIRLFYERELVSLHLKGEKSMIDVTLNPADWYMRMLSPLSPDIKLDIISRLSASLRSTVVLTAQPNAKTDNFFSALSGAWNDGTSVEDEVYNIRSSRRSNTTRNIDVF